MENADIFAVLRRLAHKWWASNTPIDADDPDAGRTICIHGNTSPLECKLCRKEDQQ